MTPQYSTITALTSAERSAELKKSFNAAEVLVSARTELQKSVAKLLTAMSRAGDCKQGELRKHALAITGVDIREKLQSIYDLVNVFEAIVDEEIELTEAQFDSMECSKLALLAPFLTKPELKDKLSDAVEAAKNGTAKQIRALKPQKDKPEKPEAEKPQGTEIPIGFVATDIAPGAPLVNSAQFKARITADFDKAAGAKDEDTLESMLALFGKAYFRACWHLGADPLDYIAELASAIAKNAKGETAAPAEAIECEAVAA